MTTRTILLTVLGLVATGVPAMARGVHDHPPRAVSTIPALFAELSRRGRSDEELSKLAGEKVPRFMREAEAVARRLQRERRPSRKTIQQLDGPVDGDR